MPPIEAPPEPIRVDEGQVIDDMRCWLERAVIGLNLCPFAKAVHVRGQIHPVVSPARSAAALLEDLARELQALVALPAETRDTTLLMAPLCLADFLEFNAMLADADRVLRRQGLEGVLQIASFHPRYQFAGTDEDDIGNFSNRAPYPTLHLLREASLDRAVAAFPDAGAIYERNIATLEALGAQGWQALHIPNVPGSGQPPQVTVAARRGRQEAEDV